MSLQRSLTYPLQSVSPILSLDGRINSVEKRLDTIRCFGQFNLSAQVLMLIRVRQTNYFTRD